MAMTAPLKLNSDWLMRIAKKSQWCHWRPMATMMIYV
jgi:hypothetical protein